jgi:hypothetical protein
MDLVQGRDSMYWKGNGLNSVEETSDSLYMPHFGLDQLLGHFGGNLEYAYLLLLEVVQLHLAGSSGLSKRGRVESFVLSGPPPIRDERKRL